MRAADRDVLLKIFLLTFVTVLLRNNGPFYVRGKRALRGIMNVICTKYLILDYCASYLKKRQQNVRMSSLFIPRKKSANLSRTFLLIKFAHPFVFYLRNNIQFYFNNRNCSSTFVSSKSYYDGTRLKRLEQRFIGVGLMRDCQN